MYEYVFLMSLVCTPISFVYHLYVLVCHSYVTRIYSYAIRMSFVCGFTMKRARKKSTFIGTKHVQNVIKLKQNFLNDLFQYLHFFHLSLGYCQFHLCMLSKHLKAASFLLMYDFPWMINGFWKFILFWHLIIPNRNELLYLVLEKRLFSNTKIFVIKSTYKIKRFIWNVFYFAYSCLHVRINV